MTVRPPFRILKSKEWETGAGKAFGQRLPGLEERNDGGEIFGRKAAGESRRPLGMNKNSLKTIRESMLLSKGELARKAGISPITVDRIEKGLPCRMETQRKILCALGYSPKDRFKVFGE